MRRTPKVLFSLVSVVTACGGGSYGGHAQSVADREYVTGSMAPPPSPVATTDSVVPGTEHYQDYGVNPVTDPTKDRLSTFAIDVDTASYTIARRKLNEGTLPPYQAVRTEEFINYFGYDYAEPKTSAFAVDTTAAPSPYASGHHIVRVAIQGKHVASADRKPVHLVYLVDTSGSMQGPDRIELAKKSLGILTQTLHSGDTVALCTYAGSVRLVLPPTSIDQKDKILRGIQDLTAGGSTAMSSGIDLAYQLANKTAVPGHVNRVVVLSDGDANVGNTSHEDMLKTIKQYADRGITLSTVGFGSGNYKDVTMEQLADKGDGNYSYIDSDEQAQRVFGEQVDGLLQVIARDVKVQVDFDPNAVKEYRLLGYENRDVADKDFRNDRVDGGEVGAGHSVTALYDVVFKPDMKGSPITVRVRAKPPTGSETATESSYPMALTSISKSFNDAPEAYRFAVAVAGFSEILRKSPHATYSLTDVERIAQAAAGNRAERLEFIGLVRKANGLSGSVAVAK